MKHEPNAIPTFGIRARAALSYVGGNNSEAMGAAGECSAGPYTQRSVCIDSY